MAYAGGTPRYHTRWRVRPPSSLIPLSVALALTAALWWTAQQPKRIAPANPAAWLERDAVNVDPPDAAPFVGVPYDCQWLPARPPCAFDAGTIEADVAVVRAQSAVGWGPSDPRASGSLDEALARLNAVDLAGLTTRQRVVLQNELLGLAIARVLRRPTTMMMMRAVDENDGARHEAERRAVTAAIAHFALAPSELDRLGSEPEPELDAWLGPRASWIDKRTPRSGLVHDSSFALRMHFRPVLAGSVRAIFGQLAAFDSAWRAHITPYVGEVELRRGRAHTAPACLARLELGCGLRPASPMLAGGSQFFGGASDGRVFCEACHLEAGGVTNQNNLAPASPSEAPAIVDARRDAFIATLQSDVTRLLEPSSPE